MKQGLLEKINNSPFFSLSLGYERIISPEKPFMNYELCFEKATMCRPVGNFVLDKLMFLVSCQSHLL
jgi:hypothetical protein